MSDEHAQPQARRLVGKVVLVAGVGFGIGAASCARLASEGAVVVAGDLDGHHAEEIAAGIIADGGTAFGRRLDITDETCATSLVAEIVRRFGKLDGVHLNAADVSMENLSLDTDAARVPLETFDHTLDVNLRGHLICTRAVLSELVATRGAIVYTSSGAATLGDPICPAYAISKAGVNALTKHVAAAWGKHGVRANAVAPGMVLRGHPREELPEIAAIKETTLAATPSPRLGRPEDIAAAVAFLLSSDAEWVNGQVLNINGGALTSR